jgi:Flavin containing amine oxidoreductase
MTEVKVAIVGSGIAGLMAALRLLERDGYHVTLFEQDDFIGGQWEAHTHGDEPDYHEHCYHVFLNWYHNFWQLTDELGLRENFEPRTAFKFLRKGEFPHMTELINVGSPRSMWHNLLSGVLPIPDMFIYGYSLIDLLAPPLHQGELLDQQSVVGFMYSRPYATARAALQHQRTLAKAFACRSYDASATTYKNFIKYGFRHPDPMLWVLKGNSYEYFLQHLEHRLNRYKERFVLKKLTRVDKIHLDNSGKVIGLDLSQLDRSPTGFPGEHIRVLAQRYEALQGYLIVAVPPRALENLVDDSIFRAAPELGNVRKLRTEPMASLDLYFTRKLRHIPRDHVTLLGSKYELTFIDNSQLWPSHYQKTTFLNIVASDFAVLAGIDPEEAEKYILEELYRYIPIFDPNPDNGDIDKDRSHFHTNTGERLFINDVGNWPFRPTTTCKIPNLFIAGDYCQTFIDVVTIEGAIVSGLMAAEAVRRRAGVGRPIKIIEPDSYPELYFTALALLGAPYAYAAKWWAWVSEQMWPPYAERFPDDES